MTNGEKWLAACIKRLEGYCKARGFTVAGYRDIRDCWAVAAIRDRTGHRVEVFFDYDEPAFDQPRGLGKLDFTAASFDELTEALVRRELVSKRQLALPLEVTP